MRHRIKDFFALGELEAKETRYIRRVLYIVLATALAAIGAITIAVWLVGYQSIVVATATVFGVVLLTLGLTWRGYLTAPRLIVPVVALATTTYLVADNSGLHDEAMYAYPLTIVLAGLLLGRGGIVLFTLLSLVAISTIGYGEINGWLENDFSHSTVYTHVIVFDVLLSFSGVLLYVTVGNLTSSLRRARHNERELAQSNQALQAIRDSLEEQVAERTRGLAAAKEAAEAANQELASQMWQIAGQAQLSDVMRGEQDLNTLADNVVGHLCQYLDALVGGLFLMQDGALELTGRYAYGSLEGSTRRFKLGEGTVGQAARDKAPILIADIPEDHMSIASGLGETVPKHILAVPFVYEGQVVGALELGGLAEFTPARLEFLGKAAESIAIAFHTARVRARINELLMETQQQAEEMQAQEEELRAANEELQAQTESLRASEARLREKQAELQRQTGTTG